MFGGTLPKQIFISDILFALEDPATFSDRGVLEREYDVTFNEVFFVYPLGIDKSHLFESIDLEDLINDMPVACSEVTETAKCILPAERQKWN